ncbi:hypothetical protein BJY04DRAFT_66469 [Aspergillus karnatakaensis]|uniref:F-box domain protein n=1 Tax=Aspergillus karnatakaensis TaxID=1810916 RepID=UPI003CCD1D71
MISAIPIHLPTEIVVQILDEVAADEFARQRDLHACCLVSRQWYTCAISLLWETPRINTGFSFSRFAQTISPPLGARKSKWNLGELVHKLDLSALVHHSSPSLTARLLGRVKQNLEVFIAPRASFASNSLPAISKCSKLRHLDLSLVATRIPFKDLKKSLSSLNDLQTLRLPLANSVTDSDSFRTPWPSQLRRMQFSGHFSNDHIRSFPWPRTLTNLTIRNCSDLSLSNLSSLLCSPDLNRTLRRLTISGDNHRLTPEAITATLALMPPLFFLSVPGDLVDGTFFDLLCHVGIPTLEVLELGFPNADPTLYFNTEDLLRALKFGLPSVRAVGFAEILVPDDGSIDDDTVDDFLLNREELRKSLPPSAEIVGPSVHVEPGVYYV